MIWGAQGCLLKASDVLGGGEGLGILDETQEEQAVVVLQLLHPAPLNWAVSQAPLEEGHAGRQGSHCFKKTGQVWLAL